MRAIQKCFFIAIFLALPLMGGQKTAIWLTGLPCSGKTTIARELASLFPSTLVLDGDDVRRVINADLGFSKEDREENLRRIIAMGKNALLSIDTVCIAVVSPYQHVRDNARAAFENAGYRFLEVFVDAPVNVCVQRDVKGMYAKAINREISNFTGISAPYERPQSPDLTLATDKLSLDECITDITRALRTTNPRTPHALFIGRWSPFHRGHWEIMNAVRKENPDRPLLIFVRDTANEAWSAEFRKGMVEAAMETMGIEASVRIIPDIDSVNWGRGVGYTPRMVDVDAHMHAISGTQIRESLANGDESWQQYVCPGVAEYLRKHYAPSREHDYRHDR